MEGEPITHQIPDDDEKKRPDQCPFFPDHEFQTPNEATILYPMTCKPQRGSHRLARKNPNYKSKWVVQREDIVELYLSGIASSA